MRQLPNRTQMTCNFAPGRFAMVDEILVLADDDPIFRFGTTADFDVLGLC